MVKDGGGIATVPIVTILTRRTAGMTTGDGVVDVGKIASITDTATTASTAARRWAIGASAR